MIMTHNRTHREIHGPVNENRGARGFVAPKLGHEMEPEKRIEDSAHVGVGPHVTCPASLHIDVFG